MRLSDARNITAWRYPEDTQDARVNALDQARLSLGAIALPLALSRWI